MRLPKTGKQVSEPSRAPERPLMVWDGECAFCRRWIKRWQRWTKGAVDFVPFQDLATSFPPLTRADFEAAVYLIEPDGSYSSGAEAVFRSMALAGRVIWLYRAYRSLPIFAVLCETLYYWVARNRRLLDRLGI